MSAFIRTFGSFIVEDKDLFDNRTIALFHPSFRRWLSDEEELADVYSVSIDDGVSLLADAVWDEYSNEILDYSNLLKLQVYLTKASRKKQLQIVIDDDAVLERLLDLAQKCITRAPFFQSALNALDQAEQMCLKRSTLSDRAQRILKAEIPNVKASSLFSSGDYNGVKNILAKSIDDLISMGSSETCIQGFQAACFDLSECSRVSFFASQYVKTLTHSREHQETDSAATAVQLRPLATLSG